MGSKLKDEFARLRANTTAHAVMDVWVPDFNVPDVALGFLPVVLKGGIGDLIIALPLLDKIQSMVGKIQVYSNYPEVFEAVGKSKLLAKERYFPGFDHWLGIETAPRFYLDKTFLGFKNAKVKELYGMWKKANREMPDVARFADMQPNFDHELALAAMDRGLNRNTLPFACLGIPYDQPKLEIPKDPFNDLGNYITVHDGFDLTQSDVLYRSTKSWNLLEWETLIADIKRHYPRLRIVQLGSKSSRPIPGIHHNFSGVFSIKQSLSFLKSSLLHIDGDSGLVHAAHAMGVKSIVLFGSTPPEFFGYPDNVNVAPKKCGGCWWLTRSWMKKCPLHERPVCADSIRAKHIYAEVQRLLIP